MRVLALVPCLLVTWTVALAVRRGYILTFPQKLQIDDVERFCATFYNVTGDVQVTLTLTCYGKDEVRDAALFVAGENACVTWRVPSRLTPGTCELVVMGNAEADNYTFSDTKEVEVVDTHQITFIQTDRPVYKPGQTVKFRVLTVTQYLTPVTNYIDSIAVLSPEDFQMKEWTMVEVNTGLASLEYRVSREPVLGEWKIVTLVNNRKTQQTFTIEKYVLPRFQVVMKVPQILTVATTSLDLEVCAKYTYGRPVTGRVNATVCLNNSETSWFCEKNQRPCVNISEEISGCHKFTVLTSNLNLTMRAFSLLCRPHLSMTASVTEQHTGVTVGGTQGGPRVWQERVRLQFVSPSYFKPYFPYHGKLKVTYPDGSPVPGEAVVLSISKLRVKEEFVSDENGEVAFTLTNTTHNTGPFMMNAKTLDDEVIDQKLYTVYAASTRKHVKQWYSPSNNYLTLRSEVGNRVDCGQRVPVIVGYARLPGATIKQVFYQVVSAGNIVVADDISVLLDRSQPYTPVVQGELLEPLPESEASPDTQEEPEEEFDVNRPLGPPGWKSGSDNPPGPPALPDPPGTAPVAPPKGPPVPLPDTEVGPPTELESDENSQEEQEEEEEEESLGEPTRHQFLFNFHVSQDMFPRVRLLVFFVTADGETVADTVDFSVNECMKNKVHITFSADTVSPGGQVDMKLAARAGSLCSLAMVDRSVHLHGGNDLLQRSTIEDKLASYDISSDFINDWLYCSADSEMPNFVLSPPGGYPGQDMPPGSMPGYEDRAPSSMYGGHFRKKRTIMQYYSNMYDSLLAFKLSGLVASTDLTLQTRPCLHDGQFSPPYYPGDPRGPMPGPDGIRPGPEAEIEEDDLSLVSTLRDYFPETWLWELYEVPPEGELTDSLTVPHTITKWVGSSFCISSQVGLGVSEAANVTSFQPFFLDVALPYSVIRGETVPVVVTVFNYLQHCVAIHINLEETEEFKVETDDGEEVPYTCICAGQSDGITFKLKPMVLGQINVTIQADLRAHRVSCHSAETPTGDRNQLVSDTVIKQLLVQAEGFPIEKTKSIYICPQDTGGKFKKTIESDIPERVLVPGSLRGWVSVIGDVMGPVLSGLDRLILLPTGCGEQNVLRLAPNIAVMQYLQGTGQLTDEVEAKVLDHMEEGYQEQMKFMREDGSYSAFGNADDHGSTWLSAFVFKTFRQALEYIYIDRKQIQTRTWEFLVSKQTAEGCFREDGTVLSKYMQGGVLAGDGDQKALTAYVLVAMLESFKMMKEKTPPFIALAVRCIEVEEVTDVYTLALTTYAMALYKPGSRFTAMLMEKLIDRATIDGDLMYWRREKQVNVSRSRRAPSAEIEMTAYALLAILHKDSTVPITEVIPIVRWLTEQRNAYGGFSSTQDTVVALQALALFAKRVHGDGLDVSINVVDDEGVTMDFQVSPSNSLLLQQKNLHHVQAAHHITAKGTGCVLLQSTVRYNVQNQILPNAAFSLEVTTPVDEQQLKNCRIRRVKVCTSYLAPDGESNMAVITVRMTSGWIPDVTSLERLLNYVDLGVKKYEMDYKNPDVVHFYFDKVGSELLCFEFSVALEFEVQDVKPVLARVFDYYETDLEASTFYEMSPCTRDHIVAVDIDIDRSLKLDDLNVIKEETLNEAGNGAESSLREDAGTGLGVLPEVDINVPAPPTKPSCPVCVTTGTVHVLDKLCDHKVLLIESADQLYFQEIEAGHISSRMTLPVPAIMQECPECLLLFRPGEKALAMLGSSTNLDLARADTVVLPWSDSLLPIIQQRLATCEG